MGQGMIDRRNFIVQDVPVILVEVDALFENRFVVDVEWDASLVEKTRAFEVAGLDL
jgi:hypothetical protein